MIGRPKPRVFKSVTVTPIPLFQVTDDDSE